MPTSIVIPYRDAYQNRKDEVVDSNSEYLDSLDLEEWTGTKSSTWRYWAYVDAQREPGDEPLGPPSFKLGRRRVWKRADVEKWLAEQEAATA